MRSMQNSWCMFFIQFMVYLHLLSLLQCLSVCIHSSHDGTVGGIIPICLSCGFLFQKPQTQDNERDTPPITSWGNAAGLMEYSTQQCECTVNVCSSQKPWKTDKQSSILEESLLVTGDVIACGKSLKPGFPWSSSHVATIFPFSNWMSHVRTRLCWLSQCFLIFIRVTLRVQLSGCIDSNFLGI